MALSVVSFLSIGSGFLDEIHGLYYGCAVSLAGPGSTWDQSCSLEFLADAREGRYDIQKAFHDGPLSNGMKVFASFLPLGEICLGF